MTYIQHFVATLSFEFVISATSWEIVISPPAVRLYLRQKSSYHCLEAGPSKVYILPVREKGKMHRSVVQETKTVTTHNTGHRVQQHTTGGQHVGGVVITETVEQHTTPGRVVTQQHTSRGPHIAGVVVTETVEHHTVPGKVVVHETTQPHVVGVVTVTETTTTQETVQHQTKPTPEPAPVPVPIPEKPKEDMKPVKFHVVEI